MSQIFHEYEPRFKKPRIEDKAYLNCIRQCDCLTCGVGGRSEAAHIRYPDLNFDKFATGMQEKPDDMWTLPLCAYCHRTGKNAQHNQNERKFWQHHNINPVALAVKLYALNFNVGEMQSLINKTRLLGGNL